MRGGAILLFIGLRHLCLYALVISTNAFTPTGRLKEVLQGNHITMRLKQFEVESITNAIKTLDVHAQIYLFGSRTDDAKRGAI